MHQLYVYRGERNTINIGRGPLQGATFIRDVPRPVDRSMLAALDPAAFEPWNPGDPAATGPRIGIRMIPYVQTQLCSRVFVEILRSRYPTCPITVVGVQPDLEFIYEGIRDVDVVGQINRNRTKFGIEFDLRHGISKIAFTSASMHLHPVGWKLAQAHGLIESLPIDEEWLPAVFPNPPGKASGDHLCVVENGATFKRTWPDFGKALLKLAESEGLEVRRIRGFSLESLSADIESIRRSWFTVLCGESILAFVVAHLGKHGRSVSFDDREGWKYRGQLLKAPGIGGEGRFIQGDGGASPRMTAKKVLSEALSLRDGREHKLQQGEIGDAVMLEPVRKSHGKTDARDPGRMGGRGRRRRPAARRDDQSGS